MIFRLDSVSRAATKMELFRQLIDDAPLVVYVRGTFIDAAGEYVFIHNWRTVRAITSRAIELEVDGIIAAVRPVGVFECSISAAHDIQC